MLPPIRARRGGVQYPVVPVTVSSDNEGIRITGKFPPAPRPYGDVFEEVGKPSPVIGLLVSGLTGALVGAVLTAAAVGLRITLG